MANNERENYNFDVFNEQKIGRRENQVKHRPTVTRLAKFKPLRPTVKKCECDFMETKNPRSMRKSIFFLSRPLKTATKSIFMPKGLWALDTG